MTDKEGSNFSMKIVCEKSDLLNAVQVVSEAVPSSSTMSILECILIKASDGVIRMTANDMDLGIETILKGTIEQEGMIAIESKMFQSVVRKLTADIVTITTDINFNVFINCDNNNDDDINLNGKSGEEFTFLPKLEKNEPIMISMFTLKEMIKQTIFSIGINESANKIMTGLHLLIKNDQLKITSLDGHRISIRKVSLKNIYNEKEVIIPGRTMDKISKIISGDADKDVSIYLSDAHVIFEFEDTVVVSRVIEGKYFSVDKMLSSDYETKITVNRKKILDIIDFSMLFSKEGNKKPIVLTINDGKIEIKVNSTLGGTRRNLDINKQGRDIVIGFNPKFLFDAMKVIDDEMIDMYFINPKAPCYIKDNNETYTYMILPVNLS